MASESGSGVALGLEPEEDGMGEGWSKEGTRSKEEWSWNPC